MTHPQRLQSSCVQLLLFGTVLDGGHEKKQKAPCGEKLLRERYRLSTAEAKEEAVTGSSGGRPPWGGEEEELVCGGGYKTKKRGGSRYKTTLIEIRMGVERQKTKQTQSSLTARSGWLGCACMHACRNVSYVSGLGPGLFLLSPLHFAARRWKTEEQRDCLQCNQSQKIINTCVPFLQTPPPPRKDRRVERGR